MKLNDVLNKDDRALLGVCVRMLGGEFAQVKANALKAAANAARNEPEMKKVNIARRAFNNTLISALKEKGVTNWRQYLE